jgi:hypothetical protein
MSSCLPSPFISDTCSLITICDSTAGRRAPALRQKSVRMPAEVPTKGHLRDCEAKLLDWRESRVQSQSLVTYAFNYRMVFATIVLLALSDYD